MDLLIVLVVVLFWILFIIYSRINFVGDIYCKVSVILGLVEFLVFVMFLMLVVISRYCLVIDKMVFFRIFSDFRLNMMVVIVWLFLFLISIFFYVVWLVFLEIYCFLDLVINFWYIILVLLFCFLLLFSVVFYIYIYDIFIF